MWRKKGLNPKQSKIVALIVSAIYLIVLIVVGIILRPTSQYEVLGWIIGAFCGTPQIYSAFYFGLTHSIYFFDWDALARRLDNGKE